MEFLSFKLLCTEFFVFKRSTKVLQSIKTWIARVLFFYLFQARLLWLIVFWNFDHIEAVLYFPYNHQHYCKQQEILGYSDKKRCPMIKWLPLLLCCIVSHTFCHTLFGVGHLTQTLDHWTLDEDTRNRFNFIPSSVTMKLQISLVLFFVTSFL